MQCFGFRFRTEEQAVVFKQLGTVIIALFAVNRVSPADPKFVKFLKCDEVKERDVRNNNRSAEEVVG